MVNYSLLVLCVSQLFFKEAREHWGQDNEQLSKDVKADIGQLQACRYGWWLFGVEHAQ